MTEGFRAEAVRQFNEMYAGHELTSDFAPSIVSFFVQHPSGS
jgi:hypothetical protein